MVAEVMEVVEYVDEDLDWWEKYDGEYDEELVEIVEEVVTIRRTLVVAYEVGIGAPPPPFLTPKERAKVVLEQERQAALAAARIASSSSRTTNNNSSTRALTNGHAAAAAAPPTLPSFIAAPTFQGSKPGYAFRTSSENGTGYHLDDYQLRQNPNLRQQLMQQQQQSQRQSLKGDWWKSDEPETGTAGKDWWVTSEHDKATSEAATTTTTTTTPAPVVAQPPSFIPSSTFNGSYAGYVFRTSPENGTGYHLDNYQLQRNPQLLQQLQQQYQQQQQQQQKQPPPAANAAPAPASPPGRARPKSPIPLGGGRRQTSKRLSAKRHQSIIEQAMIGIEDDEEFMEILEDEEIIEEEEEEIIEEEYYEDEDEIIEEEFYDDEEYEEYYDDEDEEYIIEEIIEEEETAEEAEMRMQLEKEIAEIERQIAEAKAAKDQRVAEGGDHQETVKEKAERMAQKSRLEACKKKKTESDFKRKAAARAKILAEREKNWGKKGKKKQKDLSEIIASKAKKQKKLMVKYKARDAAKKKAQQQKGAAGTTKTAASAEAPAAADAAAAAAAAPAEETETPQEEGKQLSMAEMLAKKAAKGIKGQEMGKAKASQDVKSAAPDDFGDDDLKLEDFLPSDEEEEEEEPELTPEQEHQKRLQWEKPSWTQAKLRTTTKGNKIKAGKYLSAPITNIPKKINEGLEDEDEDDNTPSQAALMKGAIAMAQLPKVKKAHAGLKFTGNGARIRDGRQIEKQINPKVKNKEEVKIWGADPEELKLTPRGLNARKGKILSEEITNATQQKKHAFEKPAWAKTKPSHLLKTTETGQHLKEGEDIAPKITDTSDHKKYTFAKPSWTTKKLHQTDEGKKVKEGAYLSAPIVDLNKKTMNVNMEANPAFLRMTDQGEKLMEEGNLEGPITAAPSLAKQR